MKMTETKLEVSIPLNTQYELFEFIQPAGWKDMEDDDKLNYISGILPDSIDYTRSWYDSIDPDVDIIESPTGE